MQLRAIDQPDGPANELSYYHCVLSNLPFDLPMPQVVELITPRMHTLNLRSVASSSSAADKGEGVEGELENKSEENEKEKEKEELESIVENLSLKSLRDECGYLLVPHQLHVFKEKLPKKFAMVTYFLQPIIPSSPPPPAEEGGSSSSSVSNTVPVENVSTIAALSASDKAAVAARRAKAHAYVVQYLAKEHKAAFGPTEPGMPTPTGSAADALKEVVFTYSQPSAMLNAMPFLAALDSSCELLKKKEDCADVKKLRTWLLTKAGPLHPEATVVGSDSSSTSSSTPSSSSSSSSQKSQTQVHIGAVSSVDISAAEWAWLRTQHRGLSQTANSMEAVTSVLVKGLHPFFTFKATLVA